MIASQTVTLDDIYKMLMILAVIIGLGGSFFVVRVQAARAEKKAEEASRDLAAFKELVLREYATTEALATLQDTFTKGFNHLGMRLDRLVEVIVTKGNH